MRIIHSFNPDSFFEPAMFIVIVGILSLSCCNGALVASSKLTKCVRDGSTGLDLQSGLDCKQQIVVTITLDNAQVSYFLSLGLEMTSKRGTLYRGREEEEEDCNRFHPSTCLI